MEKQFAKKRRLWVVKVPMASAFTHKARCKRKKEKSCEKLIVWGGVVESFYLSPYVSVISV